jgi:ribosomal protein S27E
MKQKTSWLNKPRGFFMDVKKINCGKLAAAMK